MSSSSAIPSSELGRGRREHIIYMPSQPAALRKIFRTRNRNENSKLHKVFASKNSWLYNFFDRLKKKRLLTCDRLLFKHKSTYFCFYYKKYFVYYYYSFRCSFIGFCKVEKCMRTKDGAPQWLTTQRPTAHPPPHHHQGWDVKFNT